MFDICKNVQKEELYAKERRCPTGQVYFCRLLGYDKGLDYQRFMRSLFQRAEQNGTVQKSPIPNPTEQEVERFSRLVNSPYLYDQEHLLTDVRKGFPGIGPESARALSESIQDTLALLQKNGAAQSILKNAYIKFMCWLRERYDQAAYGAGGKSIPCILSEGDPGKYEVYLLRILARAGCDVFLINYHSDDAYRKTDPESAYSVLVSFEKRGDPPGNFVDPPSAGEREALEQGESLRRKLDTLTVQVEINSWLNGSWLDGAEKTSRQRGGLSQKVCGMFVRYVGVDDPDVYRNRLFSFREKRQEAGAPILLADGRLDNPTPEEVSAVRRPPALDREEMIFSLAAQLSMPGGDSLLFQRAYVQCLRETGEENITRLGNFGVQLLCWLNRFRDQLRETGGLPPLFFYYGACTAKERDFLCLLARAGVDVVAAVPDKEKAAVFSGSPAGELAKAEELPSSMPCEPFPTREAKVRVATAAYHAERELDQLLYTGTGFFRNRQFTRSKPVTLKATYEEALQLWGEEAKYRPYFEAKEGYVEVPNLFAKVCGVKDGDTAQYFAAIQELITPDTLVAAHVPMLPPGGGNPAAYGGTRFYRNGEILPDEIKNSPLYHYDYINEDTQDYILEKIQELLDLKWLQSRQEHLEAAVLCTLLNLDQRVLQMIQKFDFTGAVPKLLVVTVDEKMFSLEDCILISFLNLIGFDILIFTPTGYRNLEKYIVRDAYEEYTIGEFRFGLTVPRFRPPSPKPKAKPRGLMERFFGGGKN